MITSLVRAGFGHTVRFIAMVENLRQYTNEPVSCLTPFSMHKFIDANLSASSNCNTYDLYHFLLLQAKNPPQHKKIINRNDRKTTSILKKSSVVIDDFALYGELKQLFSQKTITCALYHGDLMIKKSDSQEVLRFKRYVHRKIEKMDIFFHINLEQPKKKPDSNNFYIPIPVIARCPSMNKQMTRKLLGLSEDEKFILVHAGAAVETNVYKDLHKFYTAVNNLKHEYRIVVASSIENNDFPFHPGIIRAPLFPNGIDLIHASELVVSKPGMGILQDCIAAKKPLLFVPADRAERQVKIDILNRLLSGELPIVSKTDASTLNACIRECLSMNDFYLEGYSKVPTNGADILARSLVLLNSATKEHLHDTIHFIKEITPFSIQ